MKTPGLYSLLLLLLTGLALPAPAKDEQGHSLTRLWSAYRKAADADRPKDQADILTQIKKEAAAKRLTWDYYDACREYARVRSASDWKLREELYARADAEIERYGEPVAVYFLRRDKVPADELLAYIGQQRGRMRQAYNPEFYGRDPGLLRLDYGEVLPSLLADDYEYALWSLYGSSELPEIGEALRSCFAGRYPFDALIEYTGIRRGPADGREEALEAYVRRHDGRAVALLAREDLLLRRSERLFREDGSSEEFRRLADDCRALIAARKNFSGTEKTIADGCTAADALLGQLCDEHLSVGIEDGRATLSLRNLASVQLRILDGKKLIWERRVDNPVRSFYRADTIRIDLPALPDRDYTIKCSGGKAKADIEYSKYTLSIAHRHDAGGYGIYVADYRSGEPVPACDLLLFDRQDKLIQKVRGLVIDGFTDLPASLSERIESLRYGGSVQAEAEIGGIFRRSRKHYFYREEPAVVETDGTTPRHALLLTDRRAFTPGETVRYKVLLYEGSYTYAVRPAGIVLTAVLTGPDGRQIDRQQLTTGALGSAAGAFVLQKADRGGMYRISVREGDSVIAETAVRADEFVLPSFSLEWQDDGRFYLPGDPVRLAGSLRSYSGHDLSGAKAVYTVRERGTVIGEGELPLTQGGDFELDFRIPDDAGSYKHCIATVRVTDATGETLEFSRSVSASAYLPVDIRILNRASGYFVQPDRHDRGDIVGADTVRACIRVGAGGVQTHPGLKIEYAVLQGERTLLSGTADNGEELHLDLGGSPSGLYTLETRVLATAAGGREYRETRRQEILKIADGDTALDLDARCFFRELEEEDGIALQVGATTGPVWLVAALYGDGNRLLEQRTLRLAGIRGESGSLEQLRFARRSGYPETLTLKVFWFRDGQSFQYSVSSYKAREDFILPLSFSRFLDTTAPQTDYSFSIRTAAGAEIAAAVFDKSTETIERNVWHTVSPARRPLPGVSCGDSAGSDSAFGSSDRMVRPYALRGMLRTKSADMMLQANAVAEAADMEDAAVTSGADDGAEGVPVRENFANTLAWEPFLLAGSDGVATFRFRTADKLSTYYVQLFAHDKDFHNAVLRQEMVVTLPVKVAVVQPQFLYEDDRYVARVSLSNSTDVPVSGRISVRFLDGNDYREAAEIGAAERQISVPARGTAEFSCGIAAPRIGQLGLLVRFTADDGELGSDGVFVTVPVAPAVQRLTEAHSALLLPGADRDTLLASLRSRFVNLPGTEAGLREISILDMIREAIPEKVLPHGEDLLSQSEALYAGVLLDRLPESGKTGMEGDGRAQIIARILACRDGSGGYGWFPGMSASPILTAVLLERLAAMGDDCPAELAATLPGAVKYLDDAYFSTKVRPLWYGGLSLAQYLHVRALFPAFAFDPADADARTLRLFRKAAGAYLVPGAKRGLNGQVFEKARRMKTLRALIDDPQGSSLARAWGISFFTVRRLRRSLEKDVASLLQYAEPHRSGGIYYPNAVLPWRGLLESELYAHTLICDLLADCGHDDTAEGIRLWMMIQKETQQWGDDPACLQAIGSVLRGSEQTLQARVLALSADAELPFAEVRAAGNGFGVSRSFSRDGQPVAEGDSLRVGDKIVATYRIRNEENRSFVRLTAPRPAAFRPAEQRSGPCGWQARPFSVSGWGSIVPQGYRSVLADRTEYWFDTFPEENTTITEEYFVTQEGVFQCPAPVIESRYAPHYRANGDASAPTLVRHEAPAQSKK